jgi:hypothetical protein
MTINSKEIRSCDHCFYVYFLYAYAAGENQSGASTAQDAEKKIFK